METRRSPSIDAHGGGPTDYPLIDADPHFGRVVRYFRPSDYGVVVASTAAVPAAFLIWNRIDPGPIGRRPNVAFGLAATVGLFGGFLLAYQNSSKRFWGWSENEREREKDFKELSQLSREGKPVWGRSNQAPHILQAAANNSRWSQLKFAAFPWFNLVNHPHHGVDPAKYAPKDVENSEAFPTSSK